MRAITWFKVQIAIENLPNHDEERKNEDENQEKNLKIYP